MPDIANESKSRAATERFFGCPALLVNPESSFEATLLAAGVVNSDQICSQSLYWRSITYPPISTSTFLRSPYPTFFTKEVPAPTDT